MPASSPETRSSRVVFRLALAKKRRYIRSSMPAQSIASVPPAPEVMRRIALPES